MLEKERILLGKLMGIYERYLELYRVQKVKFKLGVVDLLVALGKLYDEDPEWCAKTLRKNDYETVVLATIPYYLDFLGVPDNNEQTSAELAMLHAPNIEHYLARSKQQFDVFGDYTRERQIRDRVVYNV